MFTQKLKNEQGFTLIEMMIVMLVISVILIITIPNVAQHNANINNKGCLAYVKMVQAQVQSYQMEQNKIPTLDELKTEGYLNGDVTSCGNTKIIKIDSSTGNVTIAESTTTSTTSSSNTTSQ